MNASAPVGQASPDGVSRPRRCAAVGSVRSNFVRQSLTYEQNFESPSNKRSPPEGGTTNGFTLNTRSLTSYRHTLKVVSSRGNPVFCGFAAFRLLPIIDHKCLPSELFPASTSMPGESLRVSIF